MYSCIPDPNPNARGELMGPLPGWCPWALFILLIICGIGAIVSFFEKPPPPPGETQS